MKSVKVTDPIMKTVENSMQPPWKETRKKTIDFANLGKTKSLADILCHQCRMQLQADDENSCKGVEQGISQKRGQAKVTCKKRFCSQCLIRHYPESYQELKKSKLDCSKWLCPACKNICKCSQCIRRREKLEDIMKNYDEYDTNWNEGKKVKVGRKRKNKFQVQEIEGKKKREGYEQIGIEEKIIGKKVMNNNY